MCEAKPNCEATPNCSACKKKITQSQMQLDHIKALANGGNNDLSNIQVLCMACHGDKTKHEKEKGYVNRSTAVCENIRRVIVRLRVLSSGPCMTCFGLRAAEFSIQGPQGGKQAIARGAVISKDKIAHFGGRLDWSALIGRMASLSIERPNQLLYRYVAT